MWGMRISNGRLSYITILHVPFRLTTFHLSAGSTFLQFAYVVVFVFFIVSIMATTNGSKANGASKNAGLHIAIIGAGMD